MATTTWILLCDESGAKGFTDQPADKDIPIGVVAGVLIAQAKYEELSAAIQKIIEPHKKTGGKFHITDLAHSTQEDIRNNIFKLIEEMDCSIIYEAFHHDLAHKAYLDEKKNLNTLNKAEKEKGFSCNSGDPKKRLLTLLFAGCLNRAHHHLTQELKIKEEIELITLTDNMDKPILEEIKSTVAGTFFFSPEIKKEITVTRYNTNTKSVEKKTGTLEYELKLPEEPDLTNQSTINLSITIDDTCSIVPDCLANSILHELTSTFEKHSDCRLSSAEAISSHQLAIKVGATSVITSGLYEYPIPVIEDVNLLKQEYLKFMGNPSFVEESQNSK